MKSSVLQSKNTTSCKLGVLVHCLARTIPNYPHRHVNAITLHVFVTVTVKLQIFDTNEPDFSPLKHGSNWQPQLGLACLYPWHIIMSALHHD